MSSGADSKPHGAGSTARTDNGVTPVGSGRGVITGVAIWLLPGTTTCPSPPGTIDPLECTHSAFSPARDIALVVGLLLVATLLIIAFVRDTDRLG
jgi:hypothetical protein